MHSVLQEAILRLSGVVNLEQLEEAVKDALEAALPNTVSTFTHHIFLSVVQTLLHLFQLKSEK